MKKLRINCQGGSWITLQYNFPYYYWYNFNSGDYDISYYLILINE